MLVGPYPYSTWHTYLGTLAQERRIDINSNNLANTNTPGFKKDVPVFDGYMVNASKTDFSQGHMEQTENRLDLALSGPGFFQLDTPQGIRYTRNGSFSVNANGGIVNMDGHPVVGNINIPPGTLDLNITEDGSVFADGQQIGQFELVEFEDPNVLAKEGAGNFIPKIDDAQTVDPDNTTVHQGYLERSNVDPVMASIELIDTVRTYEVFQKVTHAFQEIGQKTINEVGRLL
jgi:flagellar basal-body rod protein FlgF